MGGPTTAAGAKLGRYQIVKHLASGGMAEVLLARATGIEGFTRHVVIKRIRPGQANDQAFVQMFLNEARIAAQLHHANIVQVHDIGQEGNEYFFAMEYVHGEDLRRLLTHVARNRQKVPLEHVVTIISAAAVALHHAHEQRGPDRKPLGIVHRDVTPANILVGYDGNVKVVDFGIAKAALKTEETQAGTLKGKASYMSPEQCTGGKVDRRSDVFALGIVLYELVTARRLFKAENDFLTMSAIVAGKVPPARMHRPDLPDGLDAIITKALALAPASRYQTADEMREALEQFAASAGLRTSTSALAAYMKQQFGERPEPWLVADDDVDVEVVVDFDGSASAIVSPPDESLHQLAIPTSVDAMNSSPIVKARSKAITTRPGKKDQPAARPATTTRSLPLAPPGVPNKPLTAQIPTLSAVPAADKPKFRIDTGPIPVPQAPRRKPKTVQIPTTAQVAATPPARASSPAVPGPQPSSGVPELDADASDSAVTTVNEPLVNAAPRAVPTDIDDGWDTSLRIATGSSADVSGDAATSTASNTTTASKASTTSQPSTASKPSTASQPSTASKPSTTSETAMKPNASAAKPVDAAGAASEPSRGATTTAGHASATSRDRGLVASAGSASGAKTAAPDAAPTPVTKARSDATPTPRTDATPAPVTQLPTPVAKTRSDATPLPTAKPRGDATPVPAAKLAPSTSAASASAAISAATASPASDSKPNDAAGTTPADPAPPVLPAGWGMSRKTPPTAFAHLAATAAKPLPSVVADTPSGAGAGAASTAAASAATAPTSAPTTEAKPWSLADLAGKHEKLDKNDVSAASKFDVASLSSSRTDASSLDIPIDVGTPGDAFAAADAAADADDSGPDGRDSAPSLPPPPTTRKSIKLPGIAQLPGDDPEDPVVDPPRPNQPGAIAAKFAAPQLPHARAKTPSTMPEAWPGGSSALRRPSAIRALLRSPKRVAIATGALFVVVAVVVFATGGSDPKPAAAPETRVDRAPAAPRGGEREMGVSAPPETATAEPATPEVEPATAEPPIAEPATAEPATAEPATRPPASSATITKPPAATPTARTATKPAVAKVPAASPTTRAATKPAATKPAATNPTKPAATNPTKPAATKPAATKPALTKAPATKSPVTKQPAAKQPAAKQSATKPAAKATTTRAQPATKTAKPPAKKPPAKKPAWDPNSLFPKKK